MELNALRAFIAVAESGSFSVGAEQLFLTQPAVSKRILVLEEELGTALFDRIGRKVVLTQAGRVLLPHARQSLREVEEARRAVLGLGERIAGPLALGTSHHIGLHRLPPVLAAFTSAYPQVELNIRFLDSETVCREVEAGQLELGVVTLPLADSQPLVKELIWTDPLVVVTGLGHPLAGAGGALDIEQLAPYPAVLPGAETYTRRLIDVAFAAHHVSPRVSMSTNYLETIKMLVSINLGWGVLPATLVDERLVAHDIVGIELSRELGLLTHRARNLSNAGATFIEHLRQYRS